jgi:glutaminyl-tRNA synthetase
VPAEIRLYNPLFNVPDPGAGGDLLADLNPYSLEILSQSQAEPALAAAVRGEAVQFERQGYFCADLDSTPNRLIFNRTVGLRDSWAKARVSGG